ncbi:GNAT family N-acetyltransferase [Teredinibacter haidensis]|uniref:GNAT family N-acetyltransferase n=1 Tax=Teredinibacter haidensis TaxID=2731755 RepID=UPI000948C37E|nr:GNAT family N-acetyltransferase [Teredinibacter haidensis]
MLDNLFVVVADYSRFEHKNAIAEMMRGYSGDDMGGGEPLSEEHCGKIASSLSDFGQAVTVLVFSDKENVKPVGIATSLKSFSTFYLKPILNLHDVFVVDAWRGKGVGGLLLGKTEEIAKNMGCCKLTLEVLNNNLSAKALYNKNGFNPYRLAEEAGEAMFWQKRI